MSNNEMFMLDLPGSGPVPFPVEIRETALSGSYCTFCVLNSDQDSLLRIGATPKGFEHLSSTPLLNIYQAVGLLQEFKDLPWEEFKIKRPEGEYEYKKAPSEEAYLEYANSLKG